MHLEVFIRGVRRDVDRFLSELESKYLTFTYCKHDGKKFVQGTEQKYVAQITVRTAPLNIYEIIFPEEHRDLILTTVLGKHGKPSHWHKQFDYFTAVIRKLLRLKKIPKDYDDSKQLPIFKGAMEIIPIGLKLDAYTPEGFEAL